MCVCVCVGGEGKQGAITQVVGGAAGMVPSEVGMWAGGGGGGEEEGRVIAAGVLVLLGEGV